MSQYGCLRLPAVRRRLPKNYRNYTVGAKSNAAVAVRLKKGGGLFKVTG
jgi:hypothetical protein